MSSIPNVSTHNNQMERLLKVQKEIEERTQRDRMEADRIIKDLLESGRKLSHNAGNSSPYSVRNFLRDGNNVSATVEPSRFDDQAFSGNIRLESHFTRVDRKPSAMDRISQGPQLDSRNVTPTAKSDLNNSALGNLSSQMAKDSEL